MNAKVSNLYFLRKYPGLDVFCYTTAIEYYQNNFCIYLDEYPEQEKLRQEYHAKKFIESIVKENSRTYCEEIKTDNFFYERFLRRK